MYIVNNFTSFLIISLVGCLIIYYILFIYKNWRILKFSWNHNGFFLSILPVIGKSYIIAGILLSKRVPISMLTSSQYIKKNFGYPFNVWLGSDYHYVTDNAEEIKIILNHPMCYNKANSYEHLNIIFPESVVLVPSEKWKIKRKHFQNSYKPSVLKTFVDTFYMECCNLLEDVERLNNTGCLFDYLSEYSFVNFFLTSAGLEKENCYSDLKRLGSAIARFQNTMIFRFCDPVPTNTWLLLFPSGQECMKASKEIRSIIKNLIDQKYQQHSDRPACSSNDKTLPLFDLIVNVVAKNMDENEISDEITFFAMAATETTGNALTFCFILLAMHPEIQETLYQEVMEILGDDHISNEHLHKLKYTEAVINESLRIFPPVTIMARYVGADINVGSQVIPEGVNYAVDIFHLHRNERYWPDPLKFDPTRFLPENASKIKPYTFIPFSAGPRDCLGKAQAMMVMKITVANLVRKLKITTTHKSVDEFTLTSFMTMKPTHPVNCQFSLRLDK